jgi:hypothetical protein
MKTKEQFLTGYTGSFPFLLDLQKKYIQWNRLTPTQWAAVEKCQITEERREAQKAATIASSPMAPQAATRCNVPLILKRRGASILKKDHTLPLYPFTVTVIGVVARTSKATLVDLTLTTGSVTVCRCCGKDLTDVRSQVTGIGPVCAKRYHIPYPKSTAAPEIAKFKLDLENLAQSIGVVRSWIPNRTIKSGIHILAGIPTPKQSIRQLTPPTTSNQGVSGTPTKFKVKDLIVANSSNKYGITNAKAGVMEVIEVRSKDVRDDIKVSVVNPDNGKVETYYVSSTKFELAPTGSKFSIKSKIIPFKVGDYVSGKSVAEGNKYSYTGAEMIKGEVTQVDLSRGKDCILVRALEPNPSSEYWVNPDKFNPYVEIPVMEFPDTLFRYNAKTATFESNKDMISNIDTLQKFAIKSSRTGMAITFTKTFFSKAGREVNYWQFEYNPAAYNVVQTPMKAIIFND